jgi:hypothetical protein
VPEGGAALIDVDAIIARQLDAMLPLGTVTPDWADVERRAGETARWAPYVPAHAVPAQVLRRLPVRRRALLALACAVLFVGALVAVAVFPRSSDTSSGLSTISNHGTPASLVPADRRWGKAYVLAERGGFAYLRVEKPKGFVAPPGMTNRPTCWGRGRLRGGQIEVLMVDCSAFPSAQTPVLKWISVDASDRAGGGTLLSVAGIAADGVEKMRLVSDDGQVIATAPVNANVFRFEDVAGRDATDSKLVAVDPGGREVWSGQA